MHLTKDEILLVMSQKFEALTERHLCRTPSPIEIRLHYVFLKNLSMNELGDQFNLDGFIRRIWSEATRVTKDSS